MRRQSAQNSKTKARLSLASANHKFLSEEAREMLERPPSWLMRWGTISILGILLFLLGISIFIKYPDTLPGKVVITTDPLPIKLKSKSGGRLFSLFVFDGSIVKEDASIAEIENSIGYENILKLEMQIDTVQSFLSMDDIEGLRRITRNSLLRLGDAQTSYNQLVQRISEWLLLKNENIYARRTENLKKQMTQYKSLSLIASKEQNMIDEELQQADERYKANEQLYKDKVISKMEYFDEAARLRQKKLSLEQQKKVGLQNSITLGDNSKQLMELKYDKLEKEQGLLLAIEESVRNINNYIQLWKLQYIVSAPFPGKVQYLRPLQQNETIDAGEELFAVIPSRYHYTAHVALLSEGLGKAKMGQSVHLMLDQFPYNEYGYVEGVISRISTLPNTNNSADNEAQGGVTYRVYVQLRDTLVTSFGKIIPFSPEMSGKARVITQDRNLLQRLIATIQTIEK